MPIGEGGRIGRSRRTLLCNAGDRANIAGAWRAHCQSGRLQLPTASVTHFLVKLVLAAPLSFLSAADVSHVVAASVSHFFMKLVSAAPASFLSVACDLQVAGAGVLCAWT